MPLVLDRNPTNIFDRILKKIKRGYRDYSRLHWRKKIIQAPAAPRVESQLFAYRIHMLMCKRDLEMGICACKSLILATSSPQPFVFHDDGSLEKDDVSLLLKQFPGTEIISYADSTSRAEGVFGKNSRLFAFREKGVMLMKLLDVKLFAQTEKVIIMDSDIIFFQNPVDLFARALDIMAPNSFNRDISSAYMTDLNVLENISGKKLLPLINAGLSVVNVNTVEFDKIDNWLERLQHQPIIIHRIEQSIMAMLSATSNYGTDYLPSSYDVSYHKEVNVSICKHYVGRIRFGFELEGLRYLINERAFLSRWISLIHGNEF